MSSVTRKLDGAAGRWWNFDHITFSRFWPGNGVTDGQMDRRIAVLMSSHSAHGRMRTRDKNYISTERFQAKMEKSTWAHVGEAMGQGQGHRGSSPAAPLPASAARVFVKTGGYQAFGFHTILRLSLFFWDLLMKFLENAANQLWNVARRDRSTRLCMTNGRLRRSRKSTNFSRTFVDYSRSVTIHSFIHSFIYSFIHSFIHSSLIAQKFRHEKLHEPGRTKRWPSLPVSVVSFSQSTV